jgi:glycosyltransferase involved in cell wall biosynthesis
VNESGNSAHVVFLPPVRKKQVPVVLQEFDLLYIGLQKESLFRFGISPNKLFDYMMAGLPIIQAIEAGNDIVGDATCGISIEPESVDALIAAISKLKMLEPSERSGLGSNARAYVMREHQLSELAKKMLQELRVGREG